MSMNVLHDGGMEAKVGLGNCICTDFKSLNYLSWDPYCLSPSTFGFYIVFCLGIYILRIAPRLIYYANKHKYIPTKNSCLFTCFLDLL